MGWFKKPYSEHGSAMGRQNIFGLPPGAHIETMRQKAKEVPREAPPPVEDALRSRLPAPLPPGTPLLGLRVDVDTHEGMRDGVPRLLSLLKEAGVHGTFYFAMGPDKSGQAIFNVLLRPGFLRKMLRSGAPKLYSLRTMMSGTLLPARNVALAFPEIARRAAGEGHEAGVHGWNHRAWQDRLFKFPPERVVLELERAAEAYAEIFREKPSTFASPAWLCSNESLLHQERMGLLFGSDCRGTDPFLPVIDYKVLGTPQVPATLPTLDEALGDVDKDAGSFFGRMLAQARAEEWPVLTVHAEIEGGPFAADFGAFLERAREGGVAVVPLGKLLATRLATGKPLPHCTLAYGAVEGRSGVVSCQMLEV
jgi:undecaprenyl phosphate-alpha-L-ara4FN deformylase